VPSGRTIHHFSFLCADKLSQETGETPLHCACKYSKSDAVRALLELGADLNAKDKVRGPKRPMLKHSYLDSHCVLILRFFVSSHRKDTNHYTVVSDVTKTFIILV
jgi:hypothetical protein